MVALKRVSQRRNQILRNQKRIHLATRSCPTLLQRAVSLFTEADRHPLRHYLTMIRNLWTLWSRMKKLNVNWIFLSVVVTYQTLTWVE